MQYEMSECMGVTNENSQAAITLAKQKVTTPRKGFSIKTLLQSYKNLKSATDSYVKR